VIVFTELSMSTTKESIHQTSRPRFGKIPTAARYSGRGRSRLYQWAALHPGLFRKDGTSTVVDFDILDEILDAMPVAEIKAPRARPRSAPPTDTLTT
jgi:hypothetical protein